jgi:2-succinyl-5-enolpyruvyl-6-hydroxy-3-cyclohexene-1-carboxylate synthase
MERTATQARVGLPRIGAAVMTNISLARSVLNACARAGVREVILCAGARNAPLVSVLSVGHGVHTYSFFEERSAAFFALGRMQATGKPVAVITTSGTAAAELLPAAIEADYQGLPLILLTADRPRRYRGSGAPQTIVQPGLFSHYVEKSWDIESEWSGTLEWSGHRPIHINVCFDEPLLDEELQPKSDPVFGNQMSDLRPVIHTQLSGSDSDSDSASDFRFQVSDFGFPVPLSASASEMPLRRPLIIVGGLPLSVADSTAALIQKWQRPVYAEAPSQLRGRLPALEIPERSFKTIDCDGVIHVGSVPTLRYWRDLEKSDLPVYHFSHLPFSGLPRSKQVQPLSALRAWEFESWSAPGQIAAAKQKLAALLDKYPLSEPGWVHWLSLQLPPSTRLFLGNSLPVREWDLAAAPGARPEIFVNRGVNGIDGLISTFLGAADPEKSNWALIGDLSAMYDMAGPWALQQRAVNDVNLVIINNGGGKIFHRIFHNPLFENPHALRFEGWARMWNWDYLPIEEPSAFSASKSPRVIEIIPSIDQTENFWREWEGGK